MYFIFIWGSGGDTVVVGDGGMRNCPACSGRPPTARRFDIVLNYRYWHFWFLLSWVTKREYSLVCSHCHNALEGEVLTENEISEKLSGAKDPIPFIRRRGWAIVALLLALFVALGVYSDAEDQKELERSLASRQVGAIYLADLSKISDGFKADPPAYGAMKLVSIDGSSERFVIARFGYGKEEGVRRDISKGLLRLDSYYNPDETADFTPEQLIQLSRRGVIYRVVD